MKEVILACVHISGFDDMVIYDLYTEMWISFLLSCAIPEVIASFYLLCLFRMTPRCASVPAIDKFVHAYLCPFPVWFLSYCLQYELIGYVISVTTPLQSSIVVGAGEFRLSHDLHRLPIYPLRHYIPQEPLPTSFSKMPSPPQYQTHAVSPALRATPRTEFPNSSAYLTCLVLLWRLLPVPVCSSPYFLTLQA